MKFLNLFLFFLPSLGFTEPRDPFLPALPSDRDPTSQGPLTKKRVHELETFPLSAFRLLGVMTGPKETALLAAPNGKTYFVSEKTSLGTQGGKIIKIQPDRLVIREKSTDLQGHPITAVVELKLSSPAPKASSMAPEGRDSAGGPNVP